MRSSSFFFSSCLLLSACGGNVEAPALDPSPVGPGPSPTSERFFLAVSADGDVFRSDGSATSFAKVSSEKWSVAAIASGNGRFVAVGALGSIAHSTDGATWHHVEGIPPRVMLSHVIYARAFIAIGENAAFHSPDGISWTQLGTPLQGHYFRGVASSGDGTIHGSTASYSAARMPETSGVVSIRLSDWLDSTVPVPGFTDSVWTPTGAVAVSNHAIHWRGFEPSWSSREIKAYGLATGVAVSDAGRVLVVGENGLASTVPSLSGGEWSGLTIPPNVSFVDTDFTDVAYGAGVFAATTTTGAVAVSNDGKGWTRKLALGNTRLVGIAYGPMP